MTPLNGNILVKLVIKERDTAQRQNPVKVDINKMTLLNVRIFVELDMKKKTPPNVKIFVKLDVVQMRPASNCDLTSLRNDIPKAESRGPDLLDEELASQRDQGQYGILQINLS